MIPKRIHYCWFGGKELSSEAKECIASWKKYMPDYEIVEWNETNVDINICDYVKEAYSQKKWAFVSDYFRFKILYEYGGIYVDTDVKFLKSLDHILEVGAYLGRETERDGGLVASGLGMAVEPNNEIFREMLEMYHNESFYNDDGSENLTTVVQRLTHILSKYGYREDAEYTKIQCINGIYIYPGEYFCPMGYNGVTNITENTYTIHLYSASWFSEIDRKIFQCSKKINSSGKLQRYWWIFRKKILEYSKKRKEKKC